MPETKTINWIDRDELARFRHSVESFRRGELDGERFMAMRLQQGVYGQRQDGVHMVRIKLPGGMLSAHQLEVIADILEQYSAETIASITTRQDIQLHTIALADVPQVLERMAEAGLTSREACGNTVRNLTACPLAGVCPGEHTDVQPLVEAVAQRFLRHPLTQHMPRKVKMSFSGCEADCAQGLFHDLAVIATRNPQGRFGFKVLAGGGLGHKPRKAIVVEPFIEESELLPVIEAVLALHHRYSDRKRRARARLKFLVDRLGEQGFLEKYRQELARTREVYADDALPPMHWLPARSDALGTTGAPRELLEQKQAGRYVYPVSLPLGDLSAAQMRGIAGLLHSLGLERIRVTQDQNMMLLDIPATALETVHAHLAELGLREPVAGDDVVACPGTWTCRLGITASREISRQLEGGKGDLRIRVSGCHNGCAQPYVGDIGLHGEGRRLHGKLIPHYRLHFGGDGRDGGAIALRGPEIPVARAVQAVQRVRKAYLEGREETERFSHWARRQPADYFDRLLADLATVSEADVPFVSKDFGESADFRVLQLGGGECMGAAQEVIAANFSEAAHEREYRRTFMLGRKPGQALDCAEAVARLVAQGLLDVLGQRDLPQDLPSLAARLTEALPEHAPLVEPLHHINRELTQLRDNFDQALFERLATEQDLWTLRVAEFCQQRDPQLDLSSSLPAAPDLAQAV